MAKPNAIDTLGQIVFLMMHAPHFRGQTLAQLSATILPAIEGGLAVVANAKPKDDVPGAPLGFALFAKVSDEWHAKLGDPDFETTDLPREAWTSGDHAWLVEFLANKKAASGFAGQAARALFEKGTELNLRQRSPEGAVKISAQTI